ncbi:hypothetical protein GCM10008929_16870 [Alkalibacterium psychrotolerans]
MLPTLLLWPLLILFLYITEIIGNIDETVDILEHIRPVYNFKAS